EPAGGLEQASVPVCPDPAQRVGAELLLVEVAARAAGRGTAGKVTGVIGRAEDDDDIRMCGGDLDRPQRVAAELLLVEVAARAAGRGTAGKVTGVIGRAEDDDDIRMCGGD